MNDDKTNKHFRQNNSIENTLRLLNYYSELSFIFFNREHIDGTRLKKIKLCSVYLTKQKYYVYRYNNTAKLGKKNI